MPTPTIRQRPGASRVMVAPSARQASAVRSTSSPSRRPSTRVSPMESSPKIMERCEIDLSPGTRRRPFRGVPGLLATGDGVPCACDIVGSLLGFLGDFVRSRAPNTGVFPPSRASWRRLRASACNFLFDKAMPSRLTERFPTIHFLKAITRGQTGTRLEAPVHELRRKILRSQQGPGGLPEMRHRLPGHRP